MSNPYADSARERKAETIASFVLDQRPDLTLSIIDSFTLEDYTNFARACGVNAPSAATADAIKEILTAVFGVVSQPAEDVSRPKSAAEAMVPRVPRHQPFEYPPVDELPDVPEGPYDDDLIGVEVQFEETTVVTRYVRVDPGLGFEEIIAAAMSGRAISRSPVDKVTWRNIKKLA